MAIRTRSPRQRGANVSSFSAAQPTLSVVIVNYRQWAESARLVDELDAAFSMRDGSAEIVIVDNHSPADRLAVNLRRRESVSLRRWGRNRGYARAVNEGCRLSRGDWLLLLNPDIAVDANFVDDVRALAAHIEKNEPRTGIVGFHLRNADGSAQLSAGRFPSPWNTLAGLIKPRASRKYIRAASPERRPVPWVTGCCMLLRRACLKQVGGFDDDFFLYYEDVDVCRRARRAGWDVHLEPALRAVHLHPLHGRAVSPALRLCTRHGLLAYAAKHWPRWQFALLTRYLKIETSLRQRLARFRKDEPAIRCFRVLRDAVDAVGRHEFRLARRQIEEIVNELT